MARQTSIGAKMRFAVNFKQRGEATRRSRSPRRCQDETPIGAREKSADRELLIVIGDTISRIKIVAVDAVVIEVRMVGNGLWFGRRGLVRLPETRRKSEIPVSARRRCGGNGQTNIVALGPLDESVVTLAVNLVTRLTLHSPVAR